MNGLALITKPGIYDIPIEDYHNREICPAPSISGSGLDRKSVV